jgi:hypothetical protein
MHANMVCKHRSPVVVNPVEGGGWRGHCLRCGQLGPVGSDSVEARARLQSSQSSELPEEARLAPAINPRTTAREEVSRQ